VVGEQFKLFKIKNHLSLFSNKQNTYLKRLLQLKNHDSFLFNYRGWRTVLSWLENSFIVVGEQFYRGWRTVANSETCIIKGKQGAKKSCIFFI